VAADEGQQQLPAADERRQRQRSRRREWRPGDDEPGWQTPDGSGAMQSKMGQRSKISTMSREPAIEEAS
jgi:hypothetical protein